MKKLILLIALLGSLSCYAQLPFKYKSVIIYNRSGKDNPKIYKHSGLISLSNDKLLLDGNLYKIANYIPDGNGIHFNVVIKGNHGETKFCNAGILINNKHIFYLFIDLPDNTCVNYY